MKRELEWLLNVIVSLLCAKHGDLEDATDSVLYGPSTQNKSERWWHELQERMERFFKKQLSTLVEDGDYDYSNNEDRYILLEDDLWCLSEVKCLT